MTAEAENLESKAVITTQILGNPNPTKTKQGLDGVKPGQDRAPSPGPELAATVKVIFCHRAPSER